MNAEIVTEIARHHLGRQRHLAVSPIPTGKFNTSFYVEADGHSWVVRVAPDPSSVFLFYEKDMMRQEPELHALLLEKTNVPVPRIIAFDNSRSLIASDYLIMERLPGAPFSDTAGGHGDEVLRQVGKHLRQAHDLTQDRHGYVGRHRPMEPRRTWAEAFSDMWCRLLDDIVGIGYYTPDVRSQLLSALDRHIRRFDRAIPASLLHMDVWHQNILVDDSGTVTGLIDWDRALWGDPEIEFAVLDYCGISEPPFWEGYGRSRDESEDARIRRIFYILYELQKYIVIRAGRSNDPVAARRYRDQSLSLARQIPCPTLSRTPPSP